MSNFSSWYDKEKLWRLWGEIEEKAAEKLDKKVEKLREIRTVKTGRQITEAYKEEIIQALHGKGPEKVMLKQFVKRSLTQLHKEFLFPEQNKRTAYIQFSESSDGEIRKILEFIHPNPTPNSDGWHFGDLLYTTRVQTDQVISWETSQQWESNAREVIAVTPNLVWLKQHLDDVLQQIIRHRRKRRYILINPDERERMSNIQMTIMKRRDDAPFLPNMLKIRCITDVSIFSKRNTDFPKKCREECNNLLGEFLPTFVRPVPNDIVVYRNFFKDTDNSADTVAVMSLHPVTPPYVSQPQLYPGLLDLILPPVFNSPFITWFDEIWDMLYDRETLA